MQHTLLQNCGGLSLGACLRVLALWTRGSVPPVCPGPASQAPSPPQASPPPGAPSDAAAWLCGERAGAPCWSLGAGRVVLLPHASEPADPGPAQLLGPACSQGTHSHLMDCFVIFSVFKATRPGTRLTIMTFQCCL